MARYFIMVIASFLVLFFFSCNQSSDQKDNNQTLNDIYGTWVRINIKDGVSVFKKSQELDENRPGFAILPDGRFIERKNSGWCGTPPISYANYKGKWKKLSENLLEITCGYWGGTMSYRMEIISMSTDKLAISLKYTNPKYHRKQKEPGKPDTKVTE